MVNFYDYILINLHHYFNMKRLLRYEKRQQAACDPHWKTLVPREDVKKFLKDEHLYCSVEETAFDSCDHTDVVKTENSRTIVLEKRKEFLLTWLKDHNIKVPK